jgi:hypothetical protein
MPKKKKNNNEGPAEAPVNEAVFPEAGAAQGAAAANAVTNQIPADVAELIRSTLKVLVAQRKLYALSTTLTSLTKAVVKGLEKYVDGIDEAAIRGFIKRELEAWGYVIIQARVNYLGARYIAETVMLYKSFEDIVDMIRAGRVDDAIKPVVARDGIDPMFDKLAN